MISGFYMALTINEKYARLPHSSWISAFYQSRILRLAPIYFIICLVEGVWYVHSNMPNIFSANDLNMQARSALFFINVFVFGQDLWQTILSHSGTNIPNAFIQSAVNFFGSNALGPIYVYIGQAWSLGIELIFYAMAPFVVMSRTRLLVLFISCLLIRIYFIEHTNLFPNDPWRSRFFPSNMIFFFLGTMGYWIYAVAVGFKHAKTIGRIVAVLGMCFLIGSVSFAGGMFLFDGPEDYDQARLWIFYLLLTAGLPFLFILTKEIRWDRYIGELSYPLYLVHGFTIGLLSSLPFSLLARITFIVTTTLALSSALFILVDRPIDRFRQKLVSSSETIAGQSSLYKRMSFSLSAVPLLLFLLVIFRPSSVPHLIKAIGHYNIVVFSGKFYGVPQSEAVDWQKDDLLAIRGMLVSTTMDKTENLILTSLKNAEKSP